MEVLSSNPPNTIYDIFISFRGEDVRYNLVGYLYEALCNFGITTFMDEKKLLIGDRLSETLRKRIEEARISIVILSEKYASSKWCLRELVKIIECMDDATNQILPVFYHVDPSDVRNQSGTFKESFEQLQSSEIEIYSLEPEEVKQWREALTKVGNLVGVVLKKNSPEVDGCNKITNQIFDMLGKAKLVAPNRLNNLVDMPNRLSDMNELLDFESNEVRFIGIVGMGGIGKTTIAQACYDNIAPKFDYNCCFLTISGRDLVSVQCQLLSRLLRKEDIKISQESEGANMIKNCLSRRKVLIVLDGVDETRQLENLAGSFDWFGPKSRIIITTRNKDVLSHPNLKVQIYNVKLLDYDNSFSLFCKHAFGRGGDSNEQQFIQLSKQIVEKIDGHPQALEQIGSTLYGKDINVWREELESLSLVKNKRVFKTLKISFDQLETSESQQAFLDLTCFFNRKSKGKVIEILRSLGYSPHSILQLLCDRYLIEISKCGDIIYIPNLIQAMGQQIEREAPQRTRIWLRQDAFDIFDEQHGVRHIKGLVLDNREKQGELVLKSSQLKDMSILKILDIENVKLLSRNLDNLSNQLRSIHWHGYPSQCLPLNFKAPYLFELLLPLAQTTHLWNGLKRFEKLKVIDASDCHNLVETPNLSEVRNLERLVLRNCIRLHTIDNSIISLNHLVLLDLTSCIRLRTFTSMRSLKTHTIVQLSGSGLVAGNTSIEAISGDQLRQQPLSVTYSSNTSSNHLQRQSSSTTKLRQQPRSVTYSSNTTSNNHLQRQSSSTTKLRQPPSMTNSNGHLRRQSQATTVVRPSPMTTTSNHLQRPPSGINSGHHARRLTTMATSNNQLQQRPSPTNLGGHLRRPTLTINSSNELRQPHSATNCGGQLRQTTQTINSSGPLRQTPPKLRRSTLSANSDDHL